MPAPFRWVIDRPDTPGVDAIDSTEFSDWFHPANQTAPAAQLFFGADAIDGRYEEIVASGEDTVADPPTPFDPFPADYHNALDLVNTGNSPVIVDGYSGNFRGWHHGWTMRSGTAPGGDDDPFYFTHSLGAAIGLTHIPVSVNLAHTIWTNDWLPAYPSPDIIGVEVEQTLMDPTADYWGPYADVVSADLVIRHTVNVDPSITFPISGEAVVNLNDQWGGGILFDPAGWAAQSHSDVTKAIVDNDDPDLIPLGSQVVGLPEFGAQVVDLTFHIPNFEYAPPMTGLVGVFSRITQANVELPSDDSEVFVNTGITIRPESVYVIRPPRIRWIYDRQPYRRTYPRDDALAGGATRTWPPARSVQSSNRTFGGYL